MWKQLKLLIEKKQKIKVVNEKQKYITIIKKSDWIINYWFYYVKFIIKLIFLKYIK